MLTWNPAQKCGLWPQNQRRTRMAPQSTPENNPKMLIIVDRPIGGCCIDLEPCRAAAWQESMHSSDLPGLTRPFATHPLHASMTVAQMPAMPDAALPDPVAVALAEDIGGGDV